MTKSKKMSFIILLKLMAIMLIVNAVAFDQLLFIKEYITITVYRDYCVLEGDYLFDNPNKISTKLVYPFVINDHLNFPDSIFVRDQDGERIPYETKSSGIEFPFQKQSFFNAYYRQKTDNQYFEYILTSTQNWGKPLEEMTFQINIPEYLNLTELSLSYNTLEKKDSFTTYTIKRKNYMPKENIIIQWSEK